MGIRHGRDVPRDAADEGDGARFASGGKLEDAVRAVVVVGDEPGISDLVCDLVRRDSGADLLSASVRPREKRWGRRRSSKWVRTWFVSYCWQLCWRSLR